MTIARRQEDERIAAVRRQGLLDAASDQDFDRIVQLAQTLIGAEMAAISLVDRDRQFFISRQGITLSETPRQTAFCAHTILGDRPMVVTDAALDPRFSDNPLVIHNPKVRFYAGVPLTASGMHRLGALCVLDSTPRSVTPEQLASLEHLAGLAIEQLELRRQATIDSLTGLLNRATILHVANHEFNDACIHGSPLAVLMIDLDNFKQINDVHGHAVGDAVLRTLGHTLEKAVRKADYVGRYGGEEFCVVLPGVNAEDALETAARLRTTIANTAIEWDGGSLNVTASIGVATRDDADDACLEELLATADGALYTAKDSGRNCIRLVGPAHRFDRQVLPSTSHG